MGLYYVFVEVDWRQGIEHGQKQVQVTNYGVGETKFISDDAPFYHIEDVLDAAFIHKSQNSKQIKKQNLAKKRAQLITRYQCYSALEGYCFIIVQNDEKEAIYKEIANFTLFQGLTILENEGPCYTLEVGPGETKVILIRANLDGFTQQHTISQEVHHSKQMLKRICIENNSKVQRNGVEVYVYSLNHDGGVFYLYINKTTKYNFKEEIIYDFPSYQVEKSPEIKGEYW